MINERAGRSPRRLSPAPRQCRGSPALGHAAAAAQSSGRSGRNCGQRRKPTARNPLPPQPASTNSFPPHRATGADRRHRVSGIEARSAAAAGGTGCPCHHSRRRRQGNHGSTLLPYSTEVQQRAEPLEPQTDRPRLPTSVSSVQRPRRRQSIDSGLSTRTGTRRGQPVGTAAGSPTWHQDQAVFGPSEVNQQ